MKDSHVVVVADGSRARFFMLVSGESLQEHEDLVNPAHRAHDRDKYSSTRPGANPAPGGGPGHGFDDHRAQHEQEDERHFAREIASRAVALARRHDARRLVIVAEKRMLGLLRHAIEIPAHSGIEVRDVASDLTRLTPEQILDHLAKHGALPHRHRPQTS